MLSIAVAIPICAVMTLCRRLLGVIVAVVMCGPAGMPRICWRSVLVIIERKVIVVSCRLRLLCVGPISWKVVGLTSIALMVWSVLSRCGGTWRRVLIPASISARLVIIDCRATLISIFLSVFLHVFRRVCIVGGRRISGLILTIAAKSVSKASRRVGNM